MQSFTTTASANPTFYAAQYHYPLGNPLPYVDPDGHTPCCVDQEALVNGATDVVVGADKTVANTWIAMGNFTKAFVGGIPTEPFRPTNTTQAVTMVITEDVSFFAGVLIGRANVGGVAISESQTTTAMTTRMTNASAVNTANQLQSLPRASRPNAAGADSSNG